MGQQAIRRFVAACWIGGFLCCATVFVYKFFAPSDLLRIDFLLLLSSAGAILGFLTPQLTMVLTWYARGEKRKNKLIRRQRGLVLCGASAFYQVLLVVLVIYGVLYLGFDPTPNGKGVLANTSLILTISGLLSFVGVIPLSLLFEE